MRGKVYGKIKARVNTIDVRGEGQVHSFGADKTFTRKLNKFCKRADVAKSELIREALEVFLNNNTTKEVNTMAKAKKEFDWKGLITTLHELQADVSATKLAAFIETKGVKVSSRTIGAVRANLTRG